MKRFLKGIRRGQKGFTLIELLIVVAILGVIAAVVVPNVAGFMTAGTLNAANTEAQTVKTAALSYYAEQTPPTWPVGDVTGDGAVLADYLTGTIKGTYTFDTEGIMTGSDPGTWGSDIQWNATSQVWEKVPPAP